MDFFKKHTKGFVLLSVLFAGIIIVAPDFNSQGYLAQGDHGRDLYAAQAVYRGELPYRNFWWVYGPLTPYYYGLFFKIFGDHISSMLLGKILLRIFGGILMCLAMMEVTSSIAAFICACWFMLFQQDFFFTYNHLAGLDMILGVVFCLFSYIRRSSLRSAWKALGFILGLCLIKINFGVAAWVMCLLTVVTCDLTRRKLLDTEKISFYVTALIGVPVIVFLIYWYFLNGLTLPEIRQCLPYMEGDQPYSMSLRQAISIFGQMTWITIKSNWTNCAFALIINASALRCYYLLVKNKLPAERKIVFDLSLSMLCLFYLFNFHEYLKSGVWYRGFWSQPLSMMIIFLLIDTASQSIPQYVRKAVFSFLSILAIYCWFLNVQHAGIVKNDTQYLSLPRGNVYVSNTPAWISTVKQTTEFLNKTLKTNELFFALPYDCLYYYLTDKKTPTRQLIFFQHIKIPPEQERSVIAELEKNHVNYVLLSNRAYAHQELGLGQLGKDYCPLISQYIHDNFIPIATFGDWTNEPGWATNHGTSILKRKAYDIY